MAETYTIDELMAMSDHDLNALAAELRGWSYPSPKEIKKGAWPGYSDGKDAYMEKHKWHPATDRNQSGELIIWALDRGVEFVDTITDDTPTRSLINARVETIAFCAAMLATQEIK